ncbi:MAG TPA: TIM barrel protein [Pedobacter sp.]|nr:TIM barrel protein [Pedobacter sp.]
MEIKILSPLWGNEQPDLQAFLKRVVDAGYDGIDTWIPEDKDNQSILLDYLDSHDIYLVAHQHEASGATFQKFCRSFTSQLDKCAALKPRLINSHTGRDHFSIQQFLDLIALADDFSAKTGITVLHETHRGRMGYAPQMTAELFRRNAEFLLTADFSHWTCVTESMLENFGDILKKAISRSRHIHARVGFEQGPQVPDPRAPEWQYAVSKFLGWWDEVITTNKQLGREIMTITTEFGPIPYMPTIPFSNQPVADQFEINCFMKDLLRQRYASE